MRVFRKNNYLWLILMILIVAVVAIFSLRFLIGGDEDTWICEEGQWIKHGNPAVSMPQVECKK